MSDTICIVDDEENILTTLSPHLQDEGYQVLTAQSGEEALKIIQMEPPDVVLLDIWMSSQLFTKKNLKLVMQKISLK